MPLRYKGRDGSSRRREAALAVTEWAGGFFAGDDVVISVSGHQCGDPDCSGPQTTILLMRPDQPTSAVKIRKPLESVTQADVAEVLQPLLTAVRVISVR
jgi:hypothetical protein